MATTRLTGLPTGTVTLLMTDIQGSTAMWRSSPRAMLTAVTRHRELIHAAILEHRGGLPKDQGEGDGVLAAFARATDAVEAALQLQLELRAEPWPEGTDVKVRVALHTGEAELRDDNYYGSAVSLAARIRALAWGGQTLMSQATHELVRHRLPPRAASLDLGTHTLKDFEQGEHIFELTHDELEGDFPPLQVREKKGHNLPLVMTNFVGREEAITELRAMLGSVRLLTLTGAGGSGKTRLAIEAAKEAIDDFSNGVHFVELAAVNDPNLVLPTITRSLDIHENPGASTLDSLSRFLADKSTLLILDSFERVIDAAPSLAELLGMCARLKILVTSRASLRLRGEHEFPVPPMDLPLEERLPALADVDRYEGLCLFVARASAASPDFELTEDNLADVIDICRRLDGLPLAIELAAARLRLLPLATLRERLTSRLDLLKGGARDLPARQQTLRALIDWDYELLTDEEQAVFRRLSVCTGGFSLEAAAAVADIDDLHALDVVESLAAKSLLGSVDSELGEPRGRMLQTIREYALDVLIGSGEADEVRRRHALFHLDLAERGDANLRGPDQVRWLERLETELDNMRAALAWAHEQLDSTTELRLSAALAQFWAMRGHINEGRRWIETSLGRSTGVVSPHRAKLLTGAATLARARGAYQQASTLLEECLELQRSAGDESGVAVALKDLATIKADQEDIAGARALYQESLQLSRKVGNDLIVAMTLNNLGYLAQLDGDADEAMASYEASIAASRRLDDKQGIARTLMNLGSVVREKGELERATAHLEESLLLWRELEDKWDVPDCLEEIANVLFERQRFEGAATLYGSAASIRTAIGAMRSPLEHEDYERRVTTTRAKLGDERFQRAWGRGRAFDMNGAIDFALADER